jgi:hypothetical protein
MMESQGTCVGAVATNSAMQEIPIFALLKNTQYVTKLLIYEPKNAR